MIPRKTFRGRLRVGDRTMRLGFMGWALPLLGSLRDLPRASQKADEESQSNLHYPWKGGGFRAKRAGGNLGVDPLNR